MAGAAGALRRALALIGCAVLAAPAHAQAADPVVVSARFDEPVTRYGHDVLGGNAEWAALRITARGCAGCGTGTRDVTIRLPRNRVFEDLAPRIVDLDRDGNPEVLVVESHLDRGARLSAWRIGGSGLVAATPYIGQRNRWLAPLGAADLDGDGHVEVAYVDRPHLARVLRVWRFRDGAFHPVARAEGLTNHRIGWPRIPGGIRDCGSGPEMITADAGWTRVMASRLVDDRIESRALGPYTDARLDEAMACR